ITESVQDFFNQLWSFATDKHNQGVYNTVCLVVLLTLPLLVLLTTLVVCCHCCFCRHANNCCCCKDAMATTRSETKKRKNSAEDLWISVKTGPMTPDRVALAMV
uniref:KIAA0040 n=1 Tax=Cyclopterus lumpus TaxID=8103 RepID=A0A8C3G469_CYCLU